MTVVNLLSADLPPGWRLEGFRTLIEDNGTERWQSIVDQEARLIFHWPHDELVEFRLTYLPGVVPQTVTLRLDGQILGKATSETLIQEALLFRQRLNSGEHTLSISSSSRNPDQRDPVLVKLTHLQLSTVQPPLDLLDRPAAEVGGLLALLGVLMYVFAVLLGLTPRPRYLKSRGGSSNLLP